MRAIEGNLAILVCGQICINVFNI